MAGLLLLLLLAPKVLAEDLWILVEGDCEGLGDHNGYWFPLGTTASGRPYYKHAEQDYWMFYDPDCAGNGGEGRWVMDSQEPWTNISADLDQDGTCLFHARYIVHDQKPPSGTWRSYCWPHFGDTVGWMNNDVNITEVPPTTTSVTGTSSTATTATITATSATATATTTSTLVSITGTTRTTTTSTVVSITGTTGTTTTSTVVSITSTTSATTTSTVVSITSTTSATTTSTVVSITSTSASTTVSTVSSTETSLTSTGSTTSSTGTGTATTTTLSSTVSTTSVSQSSTQTQITLTVTTTSATATSTSATSLSQTGTTQTGTTQSQTVSSTSLTSTDSSFTSTSTTSRMGSTSSSVTQSSTTRTSTTSSTTSTVAVVAPVEVEDTALGDAITQSLEIASTLISEDTNNVSYSTPTGNVTVVRLLSSTSNTTNGTVEPAVISISGENATFEVTVQLPASVLSNVSATTMMIVTQMTEEVDQTLPSTGDVVGESVVLGSPILEITFVEALGSQVTVIPVAGLVDPIILRISPQDPAVGDACGFFNTTTWSWSSEGTAMLTVEQLQATGFADITGTWCAVSHLTAFAIVQRVPFEFLHDQAADVLAASYTTSVAVACGFLLCAVLSCCFIMLQLRAPTKGMATLVVKDAKKAKMTNVSFTCSDCEVTGSSTGQSEGTRKVLVRWDLKPARIMKQLNTLELRDVSTQLNTRPRPVVRSASRSNSRPLSSPDRSPPPHEAITVGFDGFGDGVVDLDELLPDPVFDLDASLPTLPLVAPACEAFGDGELVLYCSTSHKQTVCAFILGKGQCVDSSDPAALPFYDVRLGRGQRREQVPMESLRPQLTPGTAVMAFVEDQWRAAHVTKLKPSLEMCQVDLEDGSSLSADLFDLSLRQVRRRFWRGQPCQIYRGPAQGWINATVTENIVESEDDPETVSVVWGARDDILPVPTYLVKTDYRYTDVVCFPSGSSPFSRATTA